MAASITATVKSTRTDVLQQPANPPARKLGATSRPPIARIAVDRRPALRSAVAKLELNMKELSDAAAKKNTQGIYNKTWDVSNSLANLEKSYQDTLAAGHPQKELNAIINTKYTAQYNIKQISADILRWANPFVTMILDYAITSFDGMNLPRAFAGKRAQLLTYIDQNDKRFRGAARLASMMIANPYLASDVKDPITTKATAVARYFQEKFGGALAASHSGKPGTGSITFQARGRPTNEPNANSWSALWSLTNFGTNPYLKSKFLIYGMGEKQSVIGNEKEMVLYYHLVKMETIGYLPHTLGFKLNGNTPRK